MRKLRSWRQGLRTGFLLACTASVVLLATRGGAAERQAKEPAAPIRLMLSRHYGFGNQLCRFAVDAWDGGGTMSLRCGLSTDTVGAAFAPSGPGERRRRLTSRESEAVRAMSESARLFEGGHTGFDLTASDSIFETLLFTSKRTVVLVTSGNRTFAAGARKQLLDWLRREEELLRKTPPSKDHD